jgi:hypothetical protein
MLSHQMDAAAESGVRKINLVCEALFTLTIKACAPTSFANVGREPAGARS